MDNKAIKKIENAFEEKFQIEIINEVKYYYANGRWFYPTYLKDNNEVVIEYAFTRDDAEKGRLEDGDLFPLEHGEDKVLEYALEEILE